VTRGFKEIAAMVATTTQAALPFGDNKYHILLLLIDFSPVFDAL
jgi:hypothetical protein